MTTPTPTQILDRMLEIYTDPGAWTQGYEARDESGNGVTVLNPNAVCYCTIGCGSRAFYDLTREQSFDFLPLNRALNFVSRAIVSGGARGGSLVTFNDTTGRTFAEVRSMIERARELSLQEGDAA